VNGCEKQYFKKMAEHSGKTEGRKVFHIFMVHYCYLLKDLKNKESQ